MKFTLRPYQQNAADAAIKELRRSLDPCLIEAATGAGKSLLVAYIAKVMSDLSGKRTLCLAPSQELVEQNHEKFLLTGDPASIYCAALGKKDLRHTVVFGSPGSVGKVATRIGSDIALIVVDEAQGMTPTVRAIIDAVKAENPKVRVLGLTGTPYELGKGYIYREDENGKVWGDDKARDPYFMRKVYTIGAPELIELGFLTRPIIGALGVAQYETSSIDFTQSKKKVEEQVAKVFVGRGRKTAEIVADVVYQSRGRRGVMFFAASTDHAFEIMESLDPATSALISGDPKITPKKDRKRIIADFKAQKIRHLVNVAVLCVGFDAPHVDVIAILRKTESIGLMQQIIGRGLRLFPGKDNVLILDYAENIESHCPTGDLFAPEVKAAMGGTSGGPMNAECPECKHDNEFSARKNDDGHAIDKNGYFCDLTGSRIMVDLAELDPETQKAKTAPMPAHFGRRCQAYHRARDGHSYQCGYRWSSKPCGECRHDNDIAARYCKQCKAELIDPNAKLRIEFKQMKRDVSQMQCDEVLSMNVKFGLSQKGNSQCTVNFITEHRSFTVYFQTEAKYQKAQAQWEAFRSITDDGVFEPSTVTYRKNSDGFFEIYNYNQPADKIE